jgi:hypothetical protein
MGANMGEYLKTVEDAIDAVAAILELPSQRERLIQSTIRIMMCVHPEAREFLADSQALLIEGGLEAMAQKRREMIEALEGETAIVVLNEEDGLIDAVGASLDALRLSDVAFRVFPELRRGCEPWRLARALRADELRFEELVTQGIRRRGGEGYRQAQQNLEKLIHAEKPAWEVRSGDLRHVYHSYLHSDHLISETPVSDAESIFAAVATDDQLVAGMFEAIAHGPDAARDLARRTFEALTSLRTILRDKAA